MTKQIPLTKGKFAIVDDEKFDVLSKIKWSMSHEYAANYKLGYMHRYLTKAPKGKVVDHINGNTLDNRIKNLRICTVSENARNGQRGL